MEEKGIGTDSTIPRHIRHIIFRKYVNVVRSKNELHAVLKPTPLGVAFAQGYSKIDPELIQPTVRQYIEQCNKKVATYCKHKYNVIKRVMEITEKKLKRFMSMFKKEIVPVIKQYKKNPKQFVLPDIKEKYKNVLLEFEYKENAIVSNTVNIIL